MERTVSTLRGVAALVGAVGVLAGAFGAHALRDGFTAQQMALWQTAVGYLFWHVLAALLALGGHAASRYAQAVAAAMLFVVGILLFSGSLFALALSAPRWVGAVTPFGGLALVAGWVTLAFAYLQGRTLRSDRETR